MDMLDYGEYEGGDYPDDLYGMMEDYGDYGNYDDYDNQMLEPPTYSELVTECMVPTLQQGAAMISHLVFFCISLNVVSQFGVPSTLLHILSIAAGFTSVAMVFENLIVHIIYLSVLGYFLLLIMSLLEVKNKGAFLGVALVCYLIFWEFFIADPKEWHRIRGVQMVLVMKLISLAFDLDSGVVKEMPDIIEFYSYVFFPGTVIYGPWMSFSTYTKLANIPLVNWNWVVSLFVNCIKSMMCLVISTCIATTLFLTYEYKWLHAYRDALSFRFSHYFISYLSSLTCIASGLGSKSNSDSTTWDYPVSKPSFIEIPRSLVEVVTNWNLPMHMWLKTYVFKTTKQFGNFAAIIMTYAASSLLHGLNFQLAAVLLSLGVYTYIEYVLRQRLAEIFSACIQAKRCKKCEHTYKSSNLFVIMTNLLFGALAMFHLAYLGVMFDSDHEKEEEGYNMSHTLGKWFDLGFVSHYIAIATYIFYWLIK
ncbi:protein-serine O-palmitoleoyltransferase porcupine-like [Anneissia japonica]|uniref:protein-serine O-palmitoleoyltransferase porcupine-like n=1 Tax=Anneissia japonica TaxID=1529436 RepID=UPI001425683B|nr:protein-serine O-palmitoleoyltransferase porcupine-like [Anneissia japonica]XP_033105520.1 protein-serine O-palmitoleoyltransferase porcupine-like [Anneissia japonica]